MSIGSTMTKTFARGQEAMCAAEPVAAADPLRPAFHFRLPVQWMNYICGDAAYTHGMAAKESWRRSDSRLPRG